MAKKTQTRRTISVSGMTYARIHTWCEQNGIPISRYTEQTILGALDASGAPVPNQPAPKRERPQAKEAPFPGSHFTF